MVCGICSGAFRVTWYYPVSCHLHPQEALANFQSPRYLENGNVRAARTFINHFVHKFTAAYPAFTSTTKPNPIPLGTTDEITLTTDGTINFAQVAVRLCQRAQGDKNKMMRESWIRLCGTYQSRGGVLAQNEIRKVGVWIL